MLGTGASASMSQRDKGGKQRALKVQQWSAGSNEDASHRRSDPTTQTEKRSPPCTQSHTTDNSCRHDSVKQTMQSKIRRTNRGPIPPLATPTTRCLSTMLENTVSTERLWCGCHVRQNTKQLSHAVHVLMFVVCVVWCTKTVITRWRLGAR